MRFIRADLLNHYEDKQKNPRRGFYRLYSFYLFNNVEEWYLDTILFEERIALIEIVLDKRNCPLSEEELRHLRIILHYFHVHEKDMILRFCYDLEGDAKHNEPDDIDVIMTHMTQLSPYLNQYHDDIMLMQGLFIGNWGEMHGSRFTNEVRLLYHYFRKLVPDIEIAMRTPQQLRYLSGTSLDYHLGLFNDALFSSDTDLGTYLIDNRYYPDPYSQWDIVHEYPFMEKVNQSHYFGGEVLHGLEPIDSSEYLNKLSYLHVDYLNNLYDEAVINAWKHDHIYDEIAARLGYCFIAHISVEDHLYADIDNIGFSLPLFDIIRLYCIVGNRKIDLHVNMKEKRHYHIKLPYYKGSYYLMMESRYGNIAFANSKDDHMIYIGTMEDL